MNRDFIENSFVSLTLVENEMAPKKLSVLVVFVALFTLATCYTCDTPDDWLEGNIAAQNTAKNEAEYYGVFDSPNVTLQGKPWPNGIVKFKLDPSLSLSDTSEVQKAFEEFHSKTCIRFQPWEEGDLDFVSIEIDNNVCGYANVCKIGGYQFVRFGKHCRTKANIVHQLAHALCLSHEHQRPDRDLYLSYSGYTNIPKKMSTYEPMGIYDYGSQMHSKCGFSEGGQPTIEHADKCGEDVTPGLSVLDVDKINLLYNCQGCQRHRWVPTAMFSFLDYFNMHTFGYKSRNGTPIYACRTQFKGQVNSGMYDDSRKTCKIGWSHKSYEIKEQVEVLTIPGGTTGEDCSVYKLENWRTAPHSSLVNVGSYFHRNESLHIAYSTLNGLDGGSENFVGKAWIPYESAEFPVGINSSVTENYQLLTCSLDTDCMGKKYFIRAC
ncbi:Zinc metalloproteinase nas-13 [Orchesella cincta]|uniref:Metalloendopeptidase n=1 Tax=Orchesella cincta TaxID=48709 RepID=A0A1D2MP65_ORCCI|nr:Zinc metalloproteinase nas-13 [Orchesella cincta]